MSTVAEREIKLGGAICEGSSSKSRHAAPQASFKCHMSWRPRAQWRESLAMVLDKYA